MFGDRILVGGEEVLAGRKEKPDPGIFLKACELAGCTPAEAIHVGDSLTTDVQGGINAGVRATVWINRHGKERPAGAAEPTFTVRRTRAPPLPPAPTDERAAPPRAQLPHIDGIVDLIPRIQA